jgi:hypothetical protein
MDKLPDIYFFLLFHFFNDPGDKLCVGSKDVGYTGPFVQVDNVLSNLFHVRDADSTTRSSTILDILHREILHFSECILEVSKPQL